MTKQAQVGIFAILALLLLFGVFYVITDFGTRHTGYRVGIHFNSAAGLTSGALVYFSGVTVGTVDSIDLLPDNTVDVILAVNKDVDVPRDSKFLIQAPLTGSPNLLIVPPPPPPRPPGAIGPTPAPAAVAMIEKRVMPVDQQPEGTNTATAADLLEAGQGEVRRLDLMLTDLQTREPKLLNTLQSTMDSANRLTVTANESMQQLSAQARTIADSLQTSLTVASSNVVDLTNSLDKTVNGNSARVNTILGQLESTSIALNKSTQSLQDLATNKDMKAQLLATTKNIADTTQTISELTADLRTLTGNPQTQNQLRDTIANIDAASQRTDSILGEFGGTSKVYGVDAGATPAPVMVPGASPYPALPYPSQSTGTPPPNDSVLTQQKRAQMKSKLGGILENLVAVQVRMSRLSGQGACCNNPLLSSDRGPQTDLNAIFLPGGGTSVMVGANDIGFRTTANLAVLESFGHGIRLGGGLLYSRPGLIGEFNAGRFGLEGRFYDFRHPMLDVYGNLAIAPGTRLFFGQRDIAHAERRAVLGLQLQF
jgi:phospholipid/cholesterol/gamma-HCH transport system substrate-binding protein